MPVLKIFQLFIFLFYVGLDTATQTTSPTEALVAWSHVDTLSQNNLENVIHISSKNLSGHLELTTLELMLTTFPNKVDVTTEKSLEYISEDEKYGRKYFKSANPLSYTDSSEYDEESATKELTDGSKSNDVINDSETSGNFVVINGEHGSEIPLTNTLPFSENYNSFNDMEEKGDVFIATDAEDTKGYYAVEMNDQESLFSESDEESDESLFELNDPTDENWFGVNFEEDSNAYEPSKNSSEFENVGKLLTETPLDLSKYSTEISVVEIVDGQRVEQKLKNNEDLKFSSEVILGNKETTTTTIPTDITYYSKEIDVTSFESVEDVEGNGNLSILNVNLENDGNETSAIDLDNFDTAETSEEITTTGKTLTAVLTSDVSSDEVENVHSSSEMQTFNYEDKITTPETLANTSEFDESLDQESEHISNGADIKEISVVEHNKDFVTTPVNNDIFTDQTNEDSAIEDISNSAESNVVSMAQNNGKFAATTIGYDISVDQTDADSVTESILYSAESDEDGPAVYFQNFSTDDSSEDLILEINGDRVEEKSINTVPENANEEKNNTSEYSSEGIAEEISGPNISAENTAYEEQDMEEISILENNEEFVVMLNAETNEDEFSFYNISAEDTNEDFSSESDENIDVGIYTYTTTEEVTVAEVDTETTSAVNIKSEENSGEINFDKKKTEVFKVDVGELDSEDHIKTEVIDKTDEDESGDDMYFSGEKENILTTESTLVTKNAKLFDIYALEKIINESGEKNNQFTTESASIADDDLQETTKPVILEAVIISEIETTEKTDTIVVDEFPSDISEATDLSFKQKDSVESEEYINLYGSEVHTTENKVTTFENENYSVTTEFSTIINDLYEKTTDTELNAGILSLGTNNFTTEYLNEKNEPIADSLKPDVVVTKLETSETFTLPEAFPDGILEIIDVSWKEGRNVSDVSSLSGDVKAAISNSDEIEENNSKPKETVVGIEVGANEEITSNENISSSSVVIFADVFPVKENISLVANNEETDIFLKEVSSSSSEENSTGPDIGSTKLPEETSATKGVLLKTERNETTVRNKTENYDFLNYIYQRILSNILSRNPGNQLPANSPETETTENGTNVVVKTKETEEKPGEKIDQINENSEEIFSEEETSSEEDDNLVLFAEDWDGDNDEYEHMFSEIINEKEHVRPVKEKVHNEENDLAAEVLSHEINSNQEHVPYIHGRVFESEANMSIKIVAEETTFYVPSHAYLHEDLDNLVLNVTWASSNKILNNSLSFILTQISKYNVIHGVQLNIVQDDEMLVWKKNVVVLPKKTDDLEKYDCIIEFEDDVEVFISNIDFLNKTSSKENNEVKPVVHLSSSEMKGRRIYHVEIATGCIAITLVVSATLYLIITIARKRSFKSKNISSVQQVAA